MQVRLAAVNQDTGEEGQFCLVDTLDMGLEDDERLDIEIAINKFGRCWIGGGAAQLFLATRSV